MAEYRYRIASHEHTVTTKHYHSVNIGTLNEAAKNNIPSNAKVTKIQIHFRGSVSSGDTDFSVGFTNSASSAPGDKLISGSLTTTNTSHYKDITSFSATYPFSITSSYSQIGMYANSGIIAKGYYCSDFEIIYTYTPAYTVTVTTNNSSYGYTTGSGDYSSGTGVTISAHPNAGYKFVQWSDGVTSAIRSVSVTANATYTAEFRPIYITYDSIFSFKQWADNYLKSWTLMNISNVTDTGFTGTALADDAYTENSQPVMNVTAGKSYTVDFQAYYPPGFQIFVFFTDANGNWDGSLTNLAMAENKTSLTFTPTTNYIVIRVDIDGTGNINTFSNFRIYPADCPYMSNSVSAAERTGRGGQAMPTPTRAGYTFKGWNTKVDGTGTTYTASNLPNDDVILYSQWEKSSNKIMIADGEEYDCIGVYAQPSTKTIIFQTELSMWNLAGTGAHTVDGWHIKILYESDPIFADMKENGIYEVVAVYKNGELIY